MLCHQRQILADATDDTEVADVVDDADVTDVADDANAADDADDADVQLLMRIDSTRRSFRLTDSHCICCSVRVRHQ